MDCILSRSGHLWNRAYPRHSQAQRESGVLSGRKMNHDAGRPELLRAIPYSV